MRPISYHHRVLLTCEAHFIIIGSYSFTRPISIIIRSYSLARPISYHHRVLLTCEAHFSNSWVLPISSSSGLTPSWGPFPSMLGLTPPRGPFLSMLGLTPPRGPFLSSLGLTHLQGPFQQILGLTLSRGPVQQILGLTPSRGPVQQIFGSYSFFQTRKNCPSIWCHHKFFQLREDGKILPQYGISKQIFPASQRWKNFAPVWHYLDRYEFPNSSCTYFLVWSKLTT